MLQKPITHKLKSISLLLLLVLLLGACGTGRYLSKGDKRFAQEQYQAAIEYYKQALAKDGGSGEINFRIAEAYRRSNRIAQAAPYYKAALDGGFKREDTYFYYGQALKANGQYEEALNEFRDYARVGTNPQLKALAAKEVENAGTISNILNSNQKYEVYNLAALNTQASEFAPYVRDNALVFSSTRGGGKQYLGNGEGFLDVFAATVTDNAASLTDSAATGVAVHEFKGINVEGLHDALATFANDGNTMVFARGNEGTKKGRQNVDLFLSLNRNGTWSEPKLLNINDPEAWDSSPAFSPNGKTLYFSSSRKGGLGGNDIYKSTMDGNGHFSDPENLGPDINTTGNESFVSVGPDGTLYIASDGLPGLGNLDLFRVENGKPVNMGQPINSPGDDFGIFPQDTTSGYFSSNREGGRGNDDLYYFGKPQRKQVVFVLDGTLYQVQEGDSQRTAVPDRPVVLLNDQGKRIDGVVTNSRGKFSFVLDSATAYSVIAEKPGFFTARQSVTTVGKTPPLSELHEGKNEVRLTAILVLNEIVEDKAIVLENIFYDYDKANIRPDAAVELDKLVQILQDNPKISIELSSHTDARGSDTYNQDLSQRRAESAVEYIISKGIDPSRITAKGYGESRLVVPNATTEEEHQRNRRTEFKVVRVEE
ncbi:OmpA family protein [Pontibacter sp. 172403-2]|uniref:OmpA family protein n=1 Tax=Pontibacter rufus TaxID=2791028 RepID=UPI0018AF56CA|nr:OmpA family protein [Pontibacter sp. 172403-2]MBF9253165.1 OmpA family protein [Pontibacter sp. 172403-2]